MAMWARGLIRVYIDGRDEVALLMPSTGLPSLLQDPTILAVALLKN